MASSVAHAERKHAWLACGYHLCIARWSGPLLALAPRSSTLLPRLALSPLPPPPPPSLPAMGHILSHPVTSKNVQRLGDQRQRVGVGQCGTAERRKEAARVEGE